MNVGKIYLDCNCVNDSSENDFLERVLFSFNLTAPSGFENYKETTTILYRKISEFKFSLLQGFIPTLQKDVVIQPQTRKLAKSYIFEWNLVKL